METVKIDILNPKARKLLKNLAELNLISIRKSGTGDFSDAIQKLRSKSINTPDLDEITQEVETVRLKRFRK